MEAAVEHASDLKRDKALRDQFLLDPAKYPLAHLIRERCYDVDHDIDQNAGCLLACLLHNCLGVIP